MKRSSKNETKTLYYKTFTDDFVESKDQEHTIKQKDVYVHKSAIYSFLSKILYRVVVAVLSVVNRLWMHIKIVNNCSPSDLPMKGSGQGFIIYANHTQPVKDVFMPSLAFRRERLYVLASPANYGIPVIGKVLPMLGGIPVVSSREGIRQLKEAVHTRLQQGSGVVIYPEAHVWPYYTKIRPLPTTAFQFAAEEGTPVYCSTVTYQKRGSQKQDGQRRDHKKQAGQKGRHIKKPRITVYIDGPFHTDQSLPLREQKVLLRDQVYQCMTERSKASTYEYIIYKNIE